jgi:Asp-tRNA(Asn)/Glu-tRNA(Gln) amidotransferase A subunit family amidase
MDQALDTDSEGYRQARAIVDAAVEQLRALGAEVVDNVAIPGVDGINAIYSMNPHETETATDAYLAELDDPPYTTLRSILLSGRVTPWRATGLANSLGRTTRDPGYLAYLLARDQLRQDVYQVMADHDLDALVHTTFDHPPSLIAPDVETNPSPADDYGLGDNRLLSPLTGWPALTVPAGFTPDGLPIGIEFLGRPFTEGMLIRFGYAFEQATRHRRPPESAPPLR